MWDRNIHVLITPSFLAVAYFGQSIYDIHLISSDFNLSSLATWIVSNCAIQFVEGEIFTTAWDVTLNVVALILSMVVNALMTGLIVFKIHKMFSEAQVEVKAAITSQTSGSADGVTKLLSRHIMIIFIIVESGMALFAIQLVRVVLSILPTTSMPNSLNLMIGINQMLNVIIRSVRFYFFVLVLITLTWLGHCTNTNFGPGLNEFVLR